MEEKLRSLKLKKATLFAQIESLAVINDSMFLQFGKVCAETMLLERKILRETKNDLE